jgi:Cdc6-like AAA superfamily ATPase
MTSAQPSGITAKYGLKQDNFILDPISDYACFARDDIKTQEIAESLDIDVVTGLAPKRLVYGPYGAGKTHTLMRTMEELGHLAAVHPVRIECPDLGKKSRFHDLYREGIMRGLGQDFVLGLFEEVVRKVGFKRPEELRAELKVWFGDEEIAKAAERLYDPNFDRLKLWRWISGVNLSRTDLDTLGQTQDLSESEAARLADVAVMLGKLLRQLRGQTLVLILDEMERLRAIGPETIVTFLSGFTRLVDPSQRWVSILIGASAAVESEMVDVFAGASPVASRLGVDAKIEIPALPDPDVDKFIERIIAYVRDPKFDVKGAIQAASKVVKEDLDARFFPFTAEAVEAIKSRTTLLTPREITMQMTRALGRAYRQSKSVIASDCVG